MNAFPLLNSSPCIFAVLLLLRTIELCLLCWYMKDTPLKVRTVPALCTLFISLIGYSVIYEVRIYTELYSVLLIHMLHLLIWGITIYILYRPGISNLITLDLLFFLFTRSSRWMFFSIRRIALSPESFLPSFLSENYLYTWLPNLLLEIILVFAAKRILPSRELAGDHKSNISLSLLAILFLYLRYSIDTQAESGTTLFGFTTLMLVYFFILIMTYIIPFLSIVQNRQRLQNQILLLNETKYQAALNRIDAEQNLKHVYHDIHKHLSCICAISDSSSKVRAYVGSLQKELCLLDTLVQTGNAMLDSVLSSRARQAQENNIQLLCDIDLSPVEFISPPDLCSIFCNALDNAYEAALDVQEPCKRIIKIKAKAVKSFLAIKVSNYYKHEPVKHGEHFISTKRDRHMHGLGLSCIAQAVHRYGGTMDIHLEEPQIFILDILIPLPKNLL